MRTPPSRHDERVSPRNYFSAASLDRAGHRRRDPDWLADRLGQSRTRLLVMRSGQIALDPDQRLALLAAAGHTIDHRKIALAEPIRTLGQFDIEVKVARDVSAKVKVWVVAKAQ